MTEASGQGTRSPDGRESPQERLNRNWNELLQELRATQTGIQIMTGFLLIIPFQARFGELDQWQRGMYLALVLGAITATALALAPVAVHRQLFRQGRKVGIVERANLIVRILFVVLAFVIAGTAAFLFDIVVSRAWGIAVGVVVLLLEALVWFVLPVPSTRVVPAREGGSYRYEDDPAAGSSPSEPDRGDDERRGS